MVRRPAGEAVAPVVGVRPRLRSAAGRRGVRAVRRSRPASPGPRRSSDDRLGGAAGAAGVAAPRPRAQRSRGAELRRSDHRRPDPAPQARLPGLDLAGGARPFSPAAPSFADRAPTAGARPQQAAQENRRTSSACLSTSGATTSGTTSSPTGSGASFGMMWREADAQWNLGKVPLTDRAPHRGTQSDPAGRRRLPGPVDLAHPRARAALGTRRAHGRAAGRRAALRQHGPPLPGVPARAAIATRRRGASASSGCGRRVSRWRGRSPKVRT